MTTRRTAAIPAAPVRDLRKALAYRERAIALTEEHGSTGAAKILGLSRGGLLAYLLGECRVATEVYAEAQMDAIGLAPAAYRPTGNGNGEAG